MQILENNFNGRKETEMTCPFCNSRFRYDEDDINYQLDGRQFVTCPCCKEDIYIDDDGEILHDADHFSYPKDFWHFSKNEHAVPMSDTWVQDTIEECIRHIRECVDPDDAWYWEVGTGDTFVIVQRHEDDESYMVIVAKDFYELELPFTNKDYC